MLPYSNINQHKYNYLLPAVCFEAAITVITAAALQLLSFFLDYAYSCSAIKSLSSFIYTIT